MKNAPFRGSLKLGSPADVDLNSILQDLLGDEYFEMGLRSVGMN